MVMKLQSFSSYLVFAYLVSIIYVWNKVLFKLSPICLITDM